MSLTAKLWDNQMKCEIVSLIVKPWALKGLGNNKIILLQEQVSLQTLGTLSNEDFNADDDSKEQ